MAKKDNYLCVLYEPGDKLVEKHGTDEIKEVESAEIRYVGIFPTQFLKFRDKPANICDLSNYYRPVEETEEKYKDGFNYYVEGKVTKQKKANTTTGTTKANNHLANALRRVKRDNTLTEEDLKPLRRTFGTPPPIKEK